MTTTPPGPVRAGTHAFITGGSSGIGLAAARRLTAQGVAVTLAARGRDRLAEAHEALTRAHPGARVRAAALDVTDAEAAAEAARAAETAFGPIETLIASAGAVVPGRFEDLPDAAFRELMEVNYFGVLNMLRAVLPRMRARGAGRVCIVGSGAALIGLPGYAAYAPTKHALRGLAETLRAECRPDGVLVSICHPPDTDTPQLAAETPLKPPELAAISAKAGVWSADRVARAMLRGLDRGKAEIFVGAELAALGRFGGVARPLLHRWLDRIADRAAGRDG